MDKLDIVLSAAVTLGEAIENEERWAALALTTTLSFLDGQTSAQEFNLIVGLWEESVLIVEQADRTLAAALAL